MIVPGSFGKGPGDPDAGSRMVWVVVALLGVPLLLAVIAGAIVLFKRNFP